jgi:DNA processing protein
MLGVGRSGPTGGDPAAAMPLTGPALTDPTMARAVRSPDRGGDGPGGSGLSEREAWVVLNGTEGVGPVSFGRLVAAFGDVRSVLRVARERDGAARLVRAAADDATGRWLSPSLARAIVDAATNPERHLEPVRRAGVDVVILADAAYPARLRRIELPPPVLFIRGSVAALDRPDSVAIVGTRRPTALGRATAGRIADAVAGLGATVVSGLALGIDSAAHHAAVRSGHPTVAVIGGGHLHLYPAGNRTLATSILRADGAVVSEFPPDTTPTRGTFPRRNRIISGLAEATIVVEAGARSGALTTAAWALEQGRGLYIVPGRLDDPTVAGSLAFLREASPEARIVAGVPELLQDLGLVGRLPRHEASGHERRTVPGPRPKPPALSAVLATLPGTERRIAAEVVRGRSSVDELVATTGLSGAGVLGTLTSLEMRGLVVEVFGRYRAAGVLASAGSG